MKFIALLIMLLIIPHPVFAIFTTIDIAPYVPAPEDIINRNPSGEIIAPYPDYSTSNKDDSYILITPPIHDNELITPPTYNDKVITPITGGDWSITSKPWGDMIYLDKYGKPISINKGSSSTMGHNLCVVTFEDSLRNVVRRVSIKKDTFIDEPKDPAVDGYSFEGWYCDKSFNQKFDFSKPVCRNITLYAKYILS